VTIREIDLPNASVRSLALTFWLIYRADWAGLWRWASVGALGPWLSGCGNVGADLPRLVP
jgi:hypothetical protein